MPPRHTYWTILFGNKPTAFRSAEREELLPTFKHIQAKHPDAVMMWFARGRLWKSPEEARDTFDRRDRPHADRPPPASRPPAYPRWPQKAGYGGDSPKPRRGDDREWRDKPQRDRPPAWPKSRSDEGAKPAWQNRGPKPAFGHRPGKSSRGGGSSKPRTGATGANRDWRDQPREDRPPRGPRPPASAWPPKAGYGEGSPKPRTGEGGDWRDKPRGDRPPAWPKPRGDQRGKPAWQNRGPKPPRDDNPPGNERAPKDPDKRGRDWRPGGTHQDPRDRFKVPRDVKRARFKQNLYRERANPRPPRKKKDEE